MPDLTDLVRPGGTGDAHDVACVAAELAHLPPPALAIMRDKKLVVIACRGSVTNFATYLRGQHPRGWQEAGRDETWDAVPGAYLPKDGVVAIATMAAPDGARVLPDSRLQGSFNIVVHETMHGIDYAFGRARSKEPHFLAARDAEVARTSLSAYETQAGDAGHEETYAESAARSFCNAPGLDRTPDLTGFWAGPFAWIAPPAQPQLDTPDEGADRTLYIGERRPAGAEVEYHMVATGPGGEIGHLTFIEPRPQFDTAPNGATSDDQPSVIAVRLPR